jgi:hypothetical protein
MAGPLERIETCWRMTGPIGKVFECGSTEPLLGAWKVNNLKKRSCRQIS